MEMEVMKCVGKLEEMQWCTVRQKDVSETEGEGLPNNDQASDTIWSRNVGYKEETRKTDWCGHVMGRAEERILRKVLRTDI